MVEPVVVSMPQACRAARFLLLREPLPGHLSQYFLNLTRQRALAHVSTDVGVGRELGADCLDGVADLLRALFGADHRADFIPQLLEEVLLVLEHVGVASGAVPGTDDAGAELARGVQRRYPLFDVSIANEVIRACYAGVAGEQDSLVGQPCERVAMGMSDTEMM